MRARIVVLVLCALCLPLVARARQSAPPPPAAPASQQPAQPAATNPPAPPANLFAKDHPWDNGTRVDLKWDLSPDDKSLQSYAISRKGPGDAAFSRVDVVPPDTASYTVSALTPNRPYLFQVTAISNGNAESAPAATTVPVAPTVQWFDGTRFWFLLVLLVFCGAVLVFIALAQRGVPLKVRKIPGLSAVDEAVGRATEMGRECLFIPGIQDMNDMQTIAGLIILSRVARTAAEYGATIKVPTCRSLVMASGRDAVQGAFLSAGRPEAYNPDSVYYVTDEQFAFVSHLQGLMVREKPAACFYMGHFYAESLILAETGNMVNAIQIAGSADPTQLPFFVAACDYTLIGEEFFAASAYLSGEPHQLGSLKGQDAGKLIVALGIIVGVIGVTLAAITGSPALQSVMDYFLGKMLT